MDCDGGNRTLATFFSFRAFACRLVTDFPYTPSPRANDTTSAHYHNHPSLLVTFKEQKQSPRRTQLILAYSCHPQHYMFARLECNALN